MRRQKVSMSAARLVTAAVASGIGYKLYERATTSKHDRVLKKTYKTVSKNTSSEATIYAAHIDVDAPDPKNVLAIDGVPDLILQGFTEPNLVVEVETGKSLNGTTRAQLEGFRYQGFKTVLVVPSGDVDAAEGFLAEHDLDEFITLATPSGIATLIG